MPRGGNKKALPAADEGLVFSPVFTGATLTYNPPAVRETEREYRAPLFPDDPAAPSHRPSFSAEQRQLQQQHRGRPAQL
ncbi:hypothetical protein DIPPA_34373 [Diplonema papillatum]|nr:hypothetical protein DIPPA_34373 [Diplonema papillatum]